MSNTVMIFVVCASVGEMPRLADILRVDWVRYRARAGEMLTADNVLQVVWMMIDY